MVNQSNFWSFLGTAVVTFAVVSLLMLLLVMAATAGPVQYKVNVVDTGVGSCGGVQWGPYLWTNWFTEIHEWHIFFGGSKDAFGDVLLIIVRWNNGEVVATLDWDRYANPTGPIRFTKGYGAGNWLAVSPGELFVVYATCVLVPTPEAWAAGGYATFPLGLGLGQYAVSVVGK